MSDCKAKMHKIRFPRDSVPDPLAVIPRVTTRRWPQLQLGAGGSHRSISAARARAAANWLSIDGTDGRTDGRTPDLYIDAYRILCGQRP